MFSLHLRRQRPQRRSLIVFVLALLALAPSPAATQTKPKSAAAKTETRAVPPRCRTDNLQGYKDALLRHDQARQAFRTKFRTGYYAVPGVLNADLLKQPPAALIEKTVKALAAIADDRTVLLLYDMAAETSEPKLLCIWLIGPAGLMAAASAELPPPSIAFLAREILRVNIRTANRQPVLRKQERSTTPEPSGTTETPPIDELSNFLLPAQIRAKLVESNASRILILPVTDLGNVPWAALPLGGAMLADKAAPVVLADVDWIMHEPPPSEARPGGLVIGDPDLSGDKRWRFGPIPAARQEAEAVSLRWSASLYVGERAKRETVLSVLSRSPGGLVYFATHGIADPVNPMDGSFLALMDDHLYARDIKKLTLIDRPLIVMSACQTGLGKVFNAGVFGLARAWWQAGASQIVMSLWNVDDAATRDLMTDFIGQLGGAATLPREEALRRAMLNARERDPDPALWAGFALFGLPTPSRR